MRPGVLTIREVATKADLKRFIRLPMRLNAGDPNWISPLIAEDQAKRLAALLTRPKVRPVFERLCGTALIGMAASVLAA